MPSQIADSPLTIEHTINTDPGEPDQEEVVFGDRDGDALTVCFDGTEFYFHTEERHGAAFSSADAATVAATILKLVAPPAGELALPLLAGVHVGAAYPIGRAMIQTLRQVLRPPSEESIFVALVALAITQARMLGAKTFAEAIAMIATIPGLPGVKHNLNDKFTDL